MRLIFGGDISNTPITPDEWGKVQQAAFGCCFSDYSLLFLIPLMTFSGTWGASLPPIVDLEPWRRGPAGPLYVRWFDEASVSLEQSAALLACRRSKSGLPRLTGAFWEHPFVRLDDRRLLALSPWHVWDHAFLGTWGKLRGAARSLYGASSHQKLGSTFGCLFERWCSALATEIGELAGFSDRVVVPRHPGASDEIEDVVFVAEGLVVLAAAKSSLIPADALKAATSWRQVVQWLERFLFSSGSGGYRCGVVRQLDRKILRLRDGEFENRGIRRDATVLPAVISFDRIAGFGPINRWIGRRCLELGLLSARPGVRPLTLLSVEGYEGVLGAARARGSVCEILDRKTENLNWLMPVDWFLAQTFPVGREGRLPSMEEEFERVTSASLELLRTMGVITD